MSVTGILRVLGDGPEEGSEEVVCCERPPLRGRRKSGGGWCTGIDSAVTREWRHDPTRATRVAPQEVMSSRWNDGTESAWHKGGTDFETRNHCRGKEGDREKQTNPPQCARTCQRRIKRRMGGSSREHGAGVGAVWECWGAEGCGRNEEGGGRGSQKT